MEIKFIDVGRVNRINDRWIPVWMIWANIEVFMKMLDEKYSKIRKHFFLLFLKKFHNFSNIKLLWFINLQNYNLKLYNSLLKSNWNSKFSISSFLHNIRRNFSRYFSLNSLPLKMFNEKYFPPPKSHVKHLIYHLGENALWSWKTFNASKIASSCNHYCFLLINFFIGSICARQSVSFNGGKFMVQNQS